MTGKQLAKLLMCIIDEQKVKWGRDSLRPGEQTYCALGLLAKGAGVPDELIGDEIDEDDIIGGDRPLNDIPELNDESHSFLDFILKLSKDKRNFPVRKRIKYLKQRVKQWQKEQQEG